jgi:hypothetical protein
LARSPVASTRLPGNECRDAEQKTASPAHSVESISLVTGVCGHRREEALPINDRPIDLACSDELP